MRVIWIKMILAILVVASTALASEMSVSVPASTTLAPTMSAALAAKPDWAYVEKRLKKASFKPLFIREMKKLYEPGDFTQVLELNVLLFLRKSDYHGTQVTDSAVEEVKSFMIEHQHVLQKAEADHEVRAAVVASLLWIESRHGQNQGRFHVPSVYLHLLQASRPPVVRHLKAQAPRFADDRGDGAISRKQFREIEKRVKKKADWALEELRALEKAHRWKWTIATRLRGSFSGAFGMPQFLPSSYVRWARSQTPPAAPDLTKAADAIQSVAYYLHDHGWRGNNAGTHVEALMQYNNSRDYAKAILALADRVEKSSIMNAR